MQHWTRKHENGVTAWVEPNADGAGFCYRCAGENYHADEAPSGGRPALDTIADAQHHADAAAHPQCTGACHQWTSAAAEAPKPDPAADGRHWFVGDERLFGIDISTEILEEGRTRTCAVPFTVDGTDLFQYEDVRRERLEFYAESRAVAAGAATAFLRGRYKDIEPAHPGEIPTETVTLHPERIVLRSRDRFAAATFEVSEEPEPTAVS